MIAGGFDHGEQRRLPVTGERQMTRVTRVAVALLAVGLATAPALSFAMPKPPVVGSNGGPQGGGPGNSGPGDKARPHSPGGKGP